MNENNIVSIGDFMTAAQDMAYLLRMFKSNYLDLRGVGIRRFAIMTNIRRSRLQKFFDGHKLPTTEEITRINNAMNIIESQFNTVKERQDIKEIEKDNLRSMIDEFNFMNTPDVLLNDTAVTTSTNLTSTVNVVEELQKVIDDIKSSPEHAMMMTEREQVMRTSLEQIMQKASTELETMDTSNSLFPALENTDVQDTPIQNQSGGRGNIPGLIHFDDNAFVKHPDLKMN